MNPFTKVLGGNLAVNTPTYDLRPIAVEDADDLFVLLSDPQVTEFMDIDVHTSVSQTIDVIGWGMGARSMGIGFRWAIRRRADGVLVGTCGLHALVWERGLRGEIGYDVGRAFWGQRVMAEVMPATLHLGFRDLGLRRIEAMVTAGNDPSCRLLERHGFRREGVLCDYAFWKGRFWDQIIYARLSDDAAG